SLLSFNADFDRQHDGESRSLAGLAFHVDVTVHHLHKSMTDGQAQAGSTILPGNRSVGLRKFLEELLPLLRSDPNAGIANSKADPLLTIHAHGLGTDRDSSRIGKLTGVADEINQNLAYFCDIRSHRSEAFGNVNFNDVRVFHCCRLERTHNLANHWRHIESLQVERHLPSFDLGEIEDVVDQ